MFGMLGRCRKLSTILLLGAGASHGSGDCIPYAPPLGSQLFERLRAQGGIASTIHGDLRTIFEKDFEEGMAEFRRRRDVDSTAFLREIARYFVQFAPGRRNLYRDLVAAVLPRRQSVAIATTNYDLLIELAASEAGDAVSYTLPPVPPNNTSLLKIHGSCHFLPDPPAVLRGVTFSGARANVEGPVRVARSVAEVIAFCDSQDSLAPAIALYAPGKDVLFSPSFVLAQQEAWVKAVSEATLIYTVGLRVLPSDAHIWGVLGSTTAEIRYAGFEPKEFVAWAEAAGHRNAHAVARTF